MAGIVTELPYHVVTVGGIGEQHTPEPSGMLRHVTEHLNPLRFFSEQFNWQNTYGPVPVWNGAAYADNMATAAARLAAHISSLIGQNRRVVPMGYSGGAHVLSTALTMLERDGVTRSDIPAAVMLSNPVRSPHDPTIVTGHAGRYGVAGVHGAFPRGMTLVDLANPVDVICSCPPPPYPVRGFADLSQHFSLADPVRWGVELLAAVKAGRLQNGWKLSSLPAWFDAVALVRGYLYDGQHTSWYIPRAIQAADVLKSALGE